MYTKTITKIKTIVRDKSLQGNKTLDVPNVVTLFGFYNLRSIETYCNIYLYPCRRYISFMLRNLTHSYICILDRQVK